MSHSEAVVAQLPRSIAIISLLSICPSVVLGAHHRRRAQRCHGPVSPQYILCLDATKPTDTSYPGVLWRPKSEAFTHPWYEWWTSRAQLCSGEGSAWMFQSSKWKISLWHFSFFKQGQLSNRLRSSSMTDGVSDQAQAPPLMVGWWQFLRYSSPYF